MEIDTKLVFHFVYPDLGMEIFFDKEGTAEQREFVLKYGFEAPAAEPI